MIIALDSNVITALWNDNDALNSRAFDALERAYNAGRLVMSGAVFAELLASPSRSEAFLNKFLLDNEIFVDWEVGEVVWRRAGLAYNAYVSRRKKSKHPPPRRILADFLIGAHAFEHGHTLLTFDDRIFRVSFPGLRMFVIE